MLLEVKDLTACYDGAKALDGVNFHIAHGEFVAILGPNGSGKSTLLKVIAGILKPVKGVILIEGKPLVGKEPLHLIKETIVFVPQGKRVFPSLTVLENIEVMLHQFNKQDREKLTNEVFSMFPVLNDRAGVLAGRLSSGEQQVVALARAMAVKPKLLLLDEPSHGLSPLWTEKIYEKITQIDKRNVSVVLVEQNIKKALEFADRCFIFKMGRLVKEGKAQVFAETMLRSSFTWADI